MPNTRKSVLLILSLIMIDKAHAGDLIWFDLGGGIASGWRTTSTMAITWIPGEWGASLWNTTFADSGNMTGCIYQDLLSVSCSEAVHATETSLVATHKYVDGHILAGIGLSSINFKEGSRDKEVLGIPLQLTLRTKRWQYVGLAVSLLGNINRKENIFSANLHWKSAHAIDNKTLGRA
jgi:hypothetical protein